MGGAIGAVEGTVVAPGVGTIGGALAGGFSGATVCLPGCFCVGLTNAGLKAIDIKNKNVYFREGNKAESKVAAQERTSPNQMGLLQAEIRDFKKYSLSTPRPKGKILIA